MLVLEDGTGVTGAQTYVTVAEADAYHAALHNTAWPAPPATGEDPANAAKEAALRKAAAYLDARCLPKASGWRKKPAQGLLFPRTGAKDYSGASIGENSIPEAYKDAQCEAALLVITGTDLAPNTPGGPQLARKRVDALEKQWFQGDTDAKPVFGWINTILTPLFGPDTGSKQLAFLPAARG